MEFETVDRNQHNPLKSSRPAYGSSRSAGASGEVEPQDFGRLAGPALRRGFTIVELLIVIVVIAILAAISIVAYTGIQQRARDAQRANDIATITKALELYYIDHGRFPTASGSNSINSLPKDPVSAPGGGITSFNYAYFTSKEGSTQYCGSAARNMYILLYKRESGDQVNRFEGDCTTTPLAYSNVSNVRVAR